MCTKKKKHFSKNDGNADQKSVGTRQHLSFAKILPRANRTYKQQSNIAYKSTFTSPNLFFYSVILRWNAYRHIFYMYIVHMYVYKEHTNMQPLYYPYCCYLIPVCPERRINSGLELPTHRIL